MTQDYSTAHMYLYKWLEQLVRIHSNQKLVSKPDMEWLLTHLQKELIKVLVALQLTRTDTIEELKFKTLCNFIYISFQETPSGVSFFVNIP